jgi:putative protein kinase ArgK-like GTPase of G3E family
MESTHPTGSAALWLPPVLRVSALHPSAGDGVPALWESVARGWERLGTAGALTRRRQAQAATWMWGGYEATLLAMARADADVARVAAALQPQLAAGHMTPRRASRHLLATFLRTHRQVAPNGGD